MFSRMPFTFLICLLSLSIIASVQAQDGPTVPSLNDAKTSDDVIAFLNSEVAKRNLMSLPHKEVSSTLAELLIPASDKLLEINEKEQGYRMKLSALLHQMRAEIAGTEQKIEAFLKEAAGREETKDMVDGWHFQTLMVQTQIKGIEATAQKFEAFLKELATKEKTEERTAFLQVGRFFSFSELAKKAEATPQNFDKFKTELKTWIGNEYADISEVASLGFQVAHRHKVPAEQIAKELTDYIQSPQCTVPAAEKKELVASLEAALKLAVGVDPKLYGKTLDDKDFDWKSLRGKHVLIKFTATWCGPCQMQIPGMIETYEKYHSKGLEIVSVYIWQHEDDPVTVVKTYVAEKKLPWIILSEALTEKAKQPAQGEFYGIEGVPTFVLVDKEGKILPLEDDDWKAALEKIFK